MEPELVLGPRPDDGPSPVPGLCQADYDEIVEEILRWERRTFHEKLVAIGRGIAQLERADRWAELFDASRSRG